MHNELSDHKVFDNMLLNYRFPEIVVGVIYIVVKAWDRGLHRQLLCAREREESVLADAVYVNNKLVIIFPINLYMSSIIFRDVNDESLFKFLQSLFH